MSLQETAFCYIFMMLATPITICLLLALRKGKEVKSQELLTKDQDVACVACHAVRQPVINGYRDLSREEFFVCFDCLKGGKAPIVGPFIAHPKTRETVSSDQYEYECSLDKEVTRVVDTVSFLTPAFPKPWRQSKVSFGKSARHDGRLHKPQWTR